MNLSKLLPLIIILFSGCEGFFPPNDISEGDTGAECSQAGYIYNGSTYNPIWVNGYMLAMEVNIFIQIACI